MNKHRALVKRILIDSSLTSFWDIVKEAKITKEDQEILAAKFVEGKSIVQISLEQNCSVEKVNKVIASAYDKISRLLMNDK